MLTRKMKDSGIEWIGEIPEDWEKVKFKYIFDYQKGKKPNLYNEPKEDLYPYISMDVQRNNLNKYQYANSRDGVLGEKNDICVLWDGANAGEFYRLRTKGVISSTSAIILRNTINPIVNKDYLFYFLKFYEIELKSSSIGMGIPHVDSFKMKNDVISFPSLKKQNIIVTELNSKTKNIGLLITETQQSIEELKKYKQSLITEAVTKGLDPNVAMKDSGIEWIGDIPEDWEFSRIKHEFTLNKGLTITKNDLKEEGIPVINYGEIHSISGFRFDIKTYSVKYVDKEYCISNKNSLIKKGDFIFADTSEDLDGSGNFKCYVGDSPCFAGSHTVILKPKKNINYLYFSYLFDSLVFRAQIQEKVQGIKVFSITQRILSSIIIFFPNEQEQEQIVAYLDEKTSLIDQLIADKTKIIEELESYKQSLIYEYVTGKKEV